MSTPGWYMHDGAAAFRFQLSGDLTQESIHDLRQACRTASSVFCGRPLLVDLSEVTVIDSAGRKLLEEWHEAGANLIVISSKAKARIERLTNLPVEVERAYPNAPEWLDRAAAIWLAVLLAALFFATTVVAASRAPAGARISAIAVMPASDGGQPPYTT